MLTLDMIFAVIQGLPADHLDYLDRAWYLLAQRLERAVKQGKDHVSAVHSALVNSTQWERDAYIHAFLQEEPVMALPDLTSRQKDALIALRCAGTSSLQQLSRILVLDRSYTRRLLDVLIEKGYAIRYFRQAQHGTCYMAITSPLSDQSKLQLAELMQAFKVALFKKHGIASSQSKESRLSPESRESHESPKSRESTESTESIESRKSMESNKSTESTEPDGIPMSHSHGPRPP